MFNQVTLIGRLVRDIETKEFESGTKISTLTLAVMRPFRDKETGEFITDFFKCQVWPGLAEKAGQHCKKGCMVVVKARLENNNYKDKDGEMKYTNKIVVDQFVALTKPESKEALMEQNEEL